MMKILFGIASMLLSTTLLSQVTKDLIVGANLDLIKSNNDGYFEKAQLGVELNYFALQKFSATGGVEYWTDENQLSFVLGGRWYPIEEAFIRLRGLIGINDISIGGGWAKPLNENWRVEAMGDLYFNGYIAIRAGVAYVIRRD